MVSPEERRALAARGAEDRSVVYLEKPVSHAALAEALGEALGEKQPNSAKRSSSPSPSPSSHPRRILLADDTTANQKLITAILRKQGHRIEAVANGLEALDMLEKYEFDAVLMDVQMPVMDGFQATAAIRALLKPSRAQVPIIAMTAHSMPGDEARCLAAGMDAYLSKPIDRHKLLEVIGNADLLRIRKPATNHLEEQSLPTPLTPRP